MMGSFAHGQIFSNEYAIAGGATLMSQTLARVLTFSGTYMHRTYVHLQTCFPNLYVSDISPHDIMRQTFTKV